MGNEMIKNDWIFVKEKYLFLAGRIVSKFLINNAYIYIKLDDFSNQLSINDVLVVFAAEFAAEMSFSPPQLLSLPLSIFHATSLCSH